jgi:hypothetical protein
MLNDASRRVEIDLSSIQCVTSHQAASFDAMHRSACYESSFTLCPAVDISYCLKHTEIRKQAATLQTKMQPTSNFVMSLS